MRLIDADALVSALNNGRLKEQTGRAVPFNAGVAFALTMVEYAQTIDAVPVVRCKDCRWWDNSEDSPYGYCMAMKHGYMSENWEIGIYRTYKGDFYCADGERGDSDDE